MEAAKPFCIILTQICVTILWHDTIGVGCETFHYVQGWAAKIYVHSRGAMNSFTITEHSNPPPCNC